MKQGQDIRDLLKIFKRRKKAFLIPFITIFSIITLIAFLLPPIYEATTTILIEEQQIPPDYVKSTVTGYVEQRLQMITQQIMSYSNLLKIIKEFNLYPEMRKKYPIEEVIDKMRDDIKLETINAETPEIRGGKPVSVTIAFTLSYQGKDPVKVQKVTNALASLYLEYNLKSREEQATSTTKFLEKECNELKKHLKELENKISKFKQEHIGELPEFATIDLQTIERLERELDDIDAQISSLKQQKVYLEGQLALVNPIAPVNTAGGKVILSPIERLKYLELQLINLKATLSPNHPDVKKLEREIKALKAQLGNVDDIQEKIEELHQFEQELADLKSRLGPKHPDVIKLTKKIEILKNEISKSNSTNNQTVNTNSTSTSTLTEPDNPAYINLLTQISSIDVQIKSLEQRKEEIKKRIEEYQKKLEKIPIVEKTYNLLLSDYENTRRKYNELMDKLIEAKIAQELEESQHGERFVIIDPAQVPQEPCKPKRLAIILIGFVLALGAGIASVAFMEYIDHSIKTPEEVQELINVPLYITIPYIETEEEKKKRKRKRLLITLFIILLGITGLVLIHLFVMPLDVLWLKIERKVSQLFT
ncbi:MAG: lipopolysaccharide biosynthesis protein [Thermodesulfobacteria bacterium]|nr:lipopolysaccharide biosynthesis protein [Thermodesulfobacteriota bacterium]